MNSIEMHQFHRDGFAAARGLFSPTEVAEIRDTFMNVTKDGPVPGISEIRDKGPEAFALEDPLSRWPRMMHPHLHPESPVGPISLNVLLDARLEAILRELMDEEPLAVQSMFYFKPPGARGQSLHQDNFYLKVQPGTCMAAWLAIDDADEENGGMVCVPGTADMEVVCPERADANLFFSTEYVAPPDGRQPVPVNLNAGDVLFFNGSLIHGSYPNRSKTRFRRSFIAHYVPASTKELSRWYDVPLSFDQQRHQIPNAIGGGPCGSWQETAH
jgi:hypothetical protein